MAEPAQRRPQGERRSGAPGRQGTRQRRSQLRVVPRNELSLRARRRRTGLAMVGLALLVSAGLFAVVVAHVDLTQNQFRLDQLQAREAAQAAEQQRLRLQVAELQSPTRIVGTAEHKLGMVVPPSVTYLEPVVPSPAVSGGTQSGGATTSPTPNGGGSPQSGGGTTGHSGR